MTWVFAGILAYITVQLMIGFWVSRFIQTEQDYLLAGRQLGPWLGTFTIFATWFGAESCIGSAGAIYEGGLSGGSADPFGFGLCLILMGLVFAVPLWRRNMTTLADLFRERYSGAVEKIAVLFMLPTTVMWAAAQIRAFGQVLSASSELDVTIAITIAALIVVIYTVAGGMLADAITDSVQGLILIIGLVAIVVFMFLNEPELPTVVAAIPAERWNLWGPADESIWLKIDTWAIPLCGSVVAQELVARVIATKSPDVARRASLQAGSMYLLVGCIPAMIGLIGFSLMPDLLVAEQILPSMAQKYLPSFLYVIFAGALVSAILSTVDSALLVASSLVSHNVVQRFRPDMTEASKVKSARIGVVVFGITAYTIAMYASGIYDLVVDAAAFGTAGIFTVVVFGLFTKMGHAKTATATLLMAMSTWLIMTYIYQIEFAFILSLGVSITTYVFVSIIDRKPDEVSRIPVIEA
jgi:SSS family transporter